jgi:5-methylcytosine-specific restriction enzyme A
MKKGAITRDDILKTLEEYDHLGRDVFLGTYRYGEASTSLIVHDGKEYDSKAVAGVAHKHQHGRPLTRQELSGGLGHSVAWLKREGFTIGVSRNPE